MSTRALGGRERGLLLRQASLLERTARHDPLPELLDDVCRMIEEATDGVTCTILLVRDGHLHQGAAPSLPPTFGAAIEGERIGPDRGSCGTAAHLGETVVAHDIATDPRWEPWREVALAHGLRACWSTPVKDEGDEVVATFAAYCSVAREPEQVELDLLAWAGHLTSIVLAQHAAEEQRLGLTRELERANARLREANRAKDQFLSLTSHELRTPLTLVLGALETLELHWSDTGAEERRRLLGATRRHARRMHRLVDDLLTMSRATGGALVPRRRPVAVAPLLDEVRRDVLPPDHPVAVDCPADVVADADPEQLVQVVTNFLTNAARHAGDGPVELTARRQDGTVRLAVRDHGPGVPEDFRAQLFEPFRQADGATPRERVGAGLGLSVVHAIIDAHDGRVWHEAPDDGGARFVVELPAADGPAPTDNG